MPDTGRRLAAIMFTDVVGFTAAAQADEARALIGLKEVEDLVRPLIPTSGGREIKSTGDGLLVEFGSALKAVECAVRIQEAVRVRNQEQPTRRIELRVGVHLGDVEERDQDVFGDAVNVAARVVTAAEPGGICISQQVYDHVQNKVSQRMVRLPAQTLKGLRAPLDLYRVELSAPVPMTARGHDPLRRLAVLPLSNISPDANDAYFAEGLTEELIAVLSRLRGLRVIARTSVSQYKDTPKSVSQIGAELGVDSVVEGSVRKAGNRIRITLQLIDVPTQEHVWANSYNRELDDVFQVQAEIAEETARALQLEVLRVGPGPEAAPSAINARAYEAYLKAGVLLSSGAGVHLSELGRLLEEATRLEPAFAAAYSRWAHVYMLALGVQMPLHEAYERARPLVRKALELDPNSSEAHMAAGSLAFQGDQDWPRAEAEYRRSIQLNPSNQEAQLWLGILLFVLQRYDEAIECFRATKQIDPASWSADFWRATALHLRGDTQESIALLERIYEERKSPGDAMRLAHGYAVAGRNADAARVLETAEASPSLTYAHYNAVTWALLGDLSRVRGLLDDDRPRTEGEYLGESRRASLYAWLGERERALDLLEKDFADGDRNLWFDYQFLVFEPLRDEPRFKALLRRYRLPEEPPPGLRRPSTPP